MTLCTDPALEKLLTQREPAASAAGSFLPLNGLSGFSVQVSLPGQTLLARRVAHGQMMPGVDRQREYRVLRKLASSGLAPRVRGRNRDWLLLDWQPGEVQQPAQWDDDLPALVEQVARLHRQPLCGYRWQLLPLLFNYWQRSDPRRHNLNWLRALKRCQRQGEPRPLRLGVLHMDIHSANLVRHHDGLHLIDWEYAADGDVALELAAIVGANGLNEAQQQRLLACYCHRQSLDYHRLRRQVRRWQPWLDLLATSWYELRWQQSGDQHFYTLAAEGWQRQQVKR